MLGFGGFDSVLNFGYTLGWQNLGQGTDKSGSNRGLDFGEVY